MIKLVSVFITSLLIWISPVWPIGQNPFPGAPFIIVNKTTNQLALFNNNQIVMVAPVATGRSSDLTPEGLFTIIVKAENPYYRKHNIPGGAKENPLGSRWIGFDAKGTDGRQYGIHGTNRPESIGNYVTAGCIRMYRKDLESLYNQVPLGTKILVIRSKDSFHDIGMRYKALTKDQ